MTVNAALRLMAGCVVLISLALGAYINQYWFYLTGFVGFNLLQSAFTGWCPAVYVFQKLGLKQEICSSEGVTINQFVHIAAGTAILASVIAVIGFEANALYLIITAVIGVSLLQSSFTGWCPAITIGRLLGFKDSVKAG